MACTEIVCGTGGWTGPLPGDPDNNSVLTATPAFGGIDVSWSYPQTNSFAVAHTLLYRGISADFNAALLIKIEGGNSYYDKQDTDQQFFYWIQFVSVNGTTGEPIGPASATARPLIEDLIEQLTQQIDSGFLAQSLKSEIDRITLIDTDLATEVQDRITSNEALSDALAQLQTDVGEARTLLQTEITNRNDGDSALVQTIDTLGASVDGNTAAIVNEQTARADADSAMAADITTLFTSVGDNAAAITSEQQARTTADEALASSYDGLLAQFGGNQVYKVRRHWDFNDGALESWYPSYATVSVIGEVLVWTTTGSNPFVAVPLSPDLYQGSEATKVRARIRRTAGSAPWEGHCYYETTGHGVSTSYRKQIEAPADPSQWTIVEWDMANLTAGGTDYIDSTIQKIRIDLVSAAGDTWEFDWISVGEPVASPGSLENQQITAAIAEERTVRASEDEALATQITTLQAQNDDLAAAIQTEQTARASQDDALAQQITTVQATLTTDIGAAQDAADAAAADAAAAAGIADSKGKVLIQSTAPAAVDQLAQNLWIDTTGGNNTPKRWNGSGWTAVTDKKAVDAANAAVAAQATADQALADAATNAAAIQTETTARISADEALAEQITTAQTVLDGNIASVETRIQTKLQKGQPTFLETWDGEDPLANWENATGAGEQSIVDSSESILGGKVLSIGNFDGNDQNWLIHSNNIPLDPTVTYRISVRFRRTAGTTGSWYLGFAGIAADGVTWCNSTGANSYSAQFYSNNGSPADTNWITATGYFKVGGTGVSNGTTLRNPRGFHANVRYIRPLFISGYNGQPGTYEVDYIRVDQIDPTLQNETDGIGALYTAKLSVNGLVGGFGVYNDGSEVEAGFDVDTFWVGRTSANKRKPFIIVNDETLIDNAVINNLEASRIDTRGLTIKDANGNIIFSAGNPLDWSRVSGSNKPADSATRNVFQGDWIANQAYVIGDIVLKGGNSWSCIQDHTAKEWNAPPSDGSASTYWTKYGAKGSEGPAGIAGAPSYQLSLSKEVYSVPASSTGVVSDFTGAYTDIAVLRNGVDDTANWSFSKVDTDLTSSLSGNRLTVSAMSSAVGSALAQITGTRTDPVNFLTDPESADANWSNGGITVSPNLDIAPDGTMTADLLVEGATSAQRYQLRTTTVPSGTKFTFSRFVRPSVNRTAVTLYIYYSSNGYLVDFDLAKGIASASNIGTGTGTCAIEDAGNGWYRLSVTVTFASAVTAVNTRIYFSNSTTGDGNATYTGDGVSYISVWGANLTAGELIPYQPSAPTLVRTFVLAKAKQGATGSNGATGTRGSIHAYISGQTVWSDTVANSYFTTNYSGVKVMNDVITQYGTNFAQTRVWNGTSWLLVAVVIDGNLLVNGTVAAEALNVELLSAISAKLGTVYSGSFGPTWAWPNPNTGGYHLSDEGLMLGTWDGSAGDYAYINKAGNAGFSNIYARGDIQASSLKANSANIVQTLHVADNAITVPASQRVLTDNSSGGPYITLTDCEVGKPILVWASSEAAYAAGGSPGDTTFTVLRYNSSSAWVTLGSFVARVHASGSDFYFDSAAFLGSFIADRTDTYIRITSNNSFDLYVNLAVMQAKR